MNNPHDRRYMQMEASFIRDDLHQMESAPNYNKWLFSLVKPYLGKRILEIGPGIGNITRQIINCADVLVGVEPNQYCNDYLKNLFSGIPKFELIEKSIENCSIDELTVFDFDTIVCMNVLEHIENDISILSTFEQVLKPGGRVVLLVPAVPQAFGPIDKAVGHFRRYTKALLKNKIGNTGLKLEKLFYSNMLGLLGWLYNARIRKLTSQNDTQIRLFNNIVPVVSFLEKKLGCPVGQSLIAISRVKE